MSRSRTSRVSPSTLIELCILKEYMGIKGGNILIPLGGIMTNNQIPINKPGHWTL